MKTTMLVAAVFALSPGAALAKTYCSKETEIILTTSGKGFKLSYTDVEGIDPCRPTDEKYVYTCQAGQGRYDLRIEPQGKGLKVTDGDDVNLLMPCK